MAKSAAPNKEIQIDITPKPLREIKTLCELFISCLRPIMLWGPVGVGKSDLIQQIGKEQGRNVIDVRLSQMESIDLRGIPFFDTNANDMKWSAPCIFPKDPGDNSILFFDEINCAPPSIQAAAYQLILNRRIGEYILPRNVAIVAAGNRQQDNGITFKMPSPLLNRFVHLEAKYDFNSWELWAKENNISEEIVDYLRNNKKHLCSFNEKSYQRAFATPRSWAFADQIFKKINESLSGKKEKTKCLIEALAACLGDTLARDFITNLKVKNLPAVKDILDGKIQEKISDEHYPRIIDQALEALRFLLTLDAQPITKNLMVSEVQTKIEITKNLSTKTDNFCKFLKLPETPPEFLAMFLTRLKKESFIVDTSFAPVYHEENKKLMETRSQYPFNFDVQDLSKKSNKI